MDGRSKSGKPDAAWQQRHTVCDAHTLLVYIRVNVRGNQPASLASLTLAQGLWKLSFDMEEFIQLSTGMAQLLFGVWFWPAYKYTTTDSVFCPGFGTEAFVPGGRTGTKGAWR